MLPAGLSQKTICSNRRRYMKKHHYCFMIRVALIGLISICGTFAVDIRAQGNVNGCYTSFDSTTMSCSCDGSSSGSVDTLFLPGYGLNNGYHTAVPVGATCYQLDGTNCSGSVWGDTTDAVYCPVPTPTPEGGGGGGYWYGHDGPYCEGGFVITDWYISYDGGLSWNYWYSDWEFYDEDCSLIIY